MSYELKPGDYIQFTEMVTPEVKTKVRDSTGGNHDFTTAERAIVPQTGSGQIKTISKGQAKIGDRKVRTARVDAGPWLKVITVVADDAILVAKQLGFDIDLATGPAASMYSTDAKDHQ